MGGRNLDFRKFLRRMSSRASIISRKSVRTQRTLNKTGSIKYGNETV